MCRNRQFEETGDLLSLGFTADGIVLALSKYRNGRRLTEKDEGAVKNALAFLDTVEQGGRVHFSAGRGLVFDPIPTYTTQAGFAYRHAPRAWKTTGAEEPTNESDLHERCEKYRILLWEIINTTANSNNELMEEVRRFFAAIGRSTLADTSKLKC